MKAYNSFLHLHGNLLAAVDVETTGNDPSQHEIIQIAVIPLDSNFEQVADHFYSNIRPEYPHRAQPISTEVHRLDLDELEIHAPSKWEVLEMFENWYERLDLPMGKNLVPIAHNWSGMESCFLREFFGIDAFGHFFHYHPRCTMMFANFINDITMVRDNNRVFNSVSLAWLCRYFQVQNDNPHDALSDAKAEGQLYKRMLEYMR